MTPLDIFLILIALVVIVALIARKPATPVAAFPSETAAGLAQLIAADLPSQFARLATRSEGLDTHLRGELSQLRIDSASSSAVLRGEVVGSINSLGDSLGKNMAEFRTDTGRQANESSEAIHNRLHELRTGQNDHMEKMRNAVEARLDALNVSNTAKLEEMRLTVDEKLHTTLQNRLTESFGQVTDQLTKVHAGLGEMTKLSAGVDDLSRIFTNVKSRGTIGEVMLETLLMQMLAPGQYEKNVKVRPNTQEIVEFAVKLPIPGGAALLPIDSKFPREAWERLETAYETGVDIVSAGKAFEAAIRFEGKKISDKYVAPPVTTSFAIMFLPTEGLYAEVMRRDGLQSDIQQNYRVTIAGPSTLAAILTSLQMGFQMLHLEGKGQAVWAILASARTQFRKFEDLMTKMDDQIGKVQNTIQEVGTRTRVINRTLREVSEERTEASLPGDLFNNESLALNGTSD